MHIDFPTSCKRYNIGEFIILLSNTTKAADIVSWLFLTSNSRTSLNRILCLKDNIIISLLEADNRVLCNANSWLIEQQVKDLVGHEHYTMADLEVTKRGSKTTYKDFQGKANPKKDEPSKDALNSRGFPSDRTVWIVFFSLLVDLLAFTVILPLFPSLLEFYASTEVSCNKSLINIKFKAEISCSSRQFSTFL